MTAHETEAHHQWPTWRNVNLWEAAILMAILPPPPEVPERLTNQYDRVRSHLSALLTIESRLLN
jgi:hypothetical protein